jgi:predicted phosphodiesterase
MLSEIKKSTPHAKLTLIAAFLLTMAASNSFAAIKMTPYLQAVTSNSIYVLAECDSTSTVRVDYGTTTSYGSSATTESTTATTASPVTYVHNIKLTGLQPNTLYHYKVTQGTSSSADSTFRTAVLPGTGFRFAWLADFRTNTSIHDGIATRVKNANPAFSLYGGDLCADSTYSMFKNEFFRTNELSLISKVPFFNAPGNHEGWTTNPKAFIQSPTSSSGTQDYYSFDYGDVHFVCINNEINDSSGSAQYNFVRDDLAATTKPWKVVFFHQPAYCAGGHGENADMKTMSTNIFVPNKVDLVLTGHSHFYQHSVVSGIHHFVIGSVGAPLTDTGTASYVKKSAKSYCYGIIDVTPTTLHLVAYNDSGSVIETLDLTKEAAPAAPSTLSAITVSGSQINMSWTDNSSDESGFKVERSTNGSNFTQIGTTNANVATYSDTGLTSGTKYYYRVRSYNATGDSAYSNIANATTITYKQVTSIGQAKAQPDGSYVDITGSSIVTLVPSESGVFYAEDSDGTAGIRVEISGSRPTLGNGVMIKGQIGTNTNGERVISSSTYTAGTTPTDFKGPRGMSNKNVGGLGYIGSETSGISTQGLLVRVWGKVTKSINDATYGRIFWLDDGSRINSGEVDGTKGIKVIESGLSPAVGDFISITGVVSSEIKSGKMIRVVRFRDRIN